MSESSLLIDKKDKIIFCNHHEEKEKEIQDLLTQQKYFGETIDGKPNGHINFISATGDLLATFNYKNGRPVGSFMVYDSLGAVKCFGAYSDDGMFQKLSYVENKNTFTWEPSKDFKCSVKMAHNGNVYYFNVNEEGNAVGKGELYINEKRKNVEFADGCIKKPFSYTSIIVTFSCIILGVIACVYLYYKFRFCYQIS